MYGNGDGDAEATAAAVLPEDEPPTEKAAPTTPADVPVTTAVPTAATAATTATAATAEATVVPDAANAAMIETTGPVPTGDGDLNGDVNPKKLEEFKEAWKRLPECAEKEMMQEKFDRLWQPDAKQGESFYPVHENNTLYSQV
jgi:hypothetical protein